jgi:RHS repeat-associated protein
MKRQLTLVFTLLLGFAFASEIGFIPSSYVDSLDPTLTDSDYSTGYSIYDELQVSIPRSQVHTIDALFLTGDGTVDVILKQGEKQFKSFNGVELLEKFNSQSGFDFNVNEDNGDDFIVVIKNKANDGTYLTDLRLFGEFYNSETEVYLQTGNFKNIDFTLPPVEEDYEYRIKLGFAEGRVSGILKGYVGSNYVRQIVTVYPYQNHSVVFDSLRPQSELSINLDYRDNEGQLQSVTVVKVRKTGERSLALANITTSNPGNYAASMFLDGDLDFEWKEESGQTNGSSIIEFDLSRPTHQSVFSAYLFPGLSPKVKLEYQTTKNDKWRKGGVVSQVNLMKSLFGYRKNRTLETEGWKSFVLGSKKHPIAKVRLILTEGKHGKSGGISEVRFYPVVEKYDDWSVYDLGSFTTDWDDDNYLYNPELDFWQPLMGKTYDRDDFLTINNCGTSRFVIDKRYFKIYDLPEGKFYLPRSERISNSIEFDADEGHVFSNSYVLITGKVKSTYKVVSVNLQDARSGDGKKSFEVPLNLEDGQHVINGRVVLPFLTIPTSQTIFVDTESPVIHKRFPRSKFVNTGDFLLSGWIDDVTAVEVFIDDVPATVNGRMFEGLAHIDEDKTKVTVKAIDALGNETIKKFKFIVDQVPATLTSITPASGTVFNTEVVSVTGTVDDSSNVFVQIRDQIVKAKDGVFVFDAISLSPGFNDLEIQLTDYAGNMVSYPYDLILDTTAPEISLEESPVFTSEFETSISFTVLDYQGLTVKVANVDVLPTVVSNLGDGLREYYFEYQTTVSSSETQLQIRAIDSVGNITESTQAIILDQEAPYIDIDLEDPVYINTDSILIEGSVFDQYLEQVTINGSVVSLSDSGTFEYNLEVPGDNALFTLIARDKAGNQSSFERVVTKDTTPPSVLGLTTYLGDTGVELYFDSSSDDVVAFELRRFPLFEEESVVVEAGFYIDPTDLTSDLTYRVRSIDRAGNVSVWVEDSFYDTFDLIPGESGSKNMGAISIEWSGNNYYKPLEITVAKVNSPSLLYEANTITPIFEFGPSGTQFTEPLIFSADLDGLVKEEFKDRLQWATFNEEYQMWEPVKTYIEPSTGLVIGEVYHFSQVTLFGSNDLSFGFAQDKVWSHYDSKLKSSTSGSGNVNVESQGAVVIQGVDGIVYGKHYNFVLKRTANSKGRFVHKRPEYKQPYTPYFENFERIMYFGGYSRNIPHINGTYFTDEQGRSIDLGNFRYGVQKQIETKSGYYTLLVEDEAEDSIKVYIKNSEGIEYYVRTSKKVTLTTDEYGSPRGASDIYLVSNLYRDDGDKDLSFTPYVREIVQEIRYPKGQILSIGPSGGSGGSRYYPKSDDAEVGISFHWLYPEEGKSGNSLFVEQTSTESIITNRQTGEYTRLTAKYLGGRQYGMTGVTRRKVGHSEVETMTYIHETSTEDMSSRTEGEAYFTIEHQDGSRVKYTFKDYHNELVDRWVDASRFGITLQKEERFDSEGTLQHQIDWEFDPSDHILTIDRTNQVKSKYYSWKDGQKTLVSEKSAQFNYHGSKIWERSGYQEKQFRYYDADEYGPIQLDVDGQTVSDSGFAYTDRFSHDENPIWFRFEAETGGYGEGYIYINENGDEKAIIDMDRGTFGYTVRDSINFRIIDGDEKQTFLVYDLGLKTFYRVQSTTDLQLNVMPSSNMLSQIKPEDLVYNFGSPIASSTIAQPLYYTEDGGVLYVRFEQNNLFFSYVQDPTLQSRVKEELTKTFYGTPFEDDEDAVIESRIFVYDDYGQIREEIINDRVKTVYSYTDNDSDSYSLPAVIGTAFGVKEDSRKTQLHGMKSFTKDEGESWEDATLRVEKINIYNSSGQIEKEVVHEPGSIEGQVETRYHYNSTYKLTRADTISDANGSRQLSRSIVYEYATNQSNEPLSSVTVLANDGEVLGRRDFEYQSPTGNLQIKKTAEEIHDGSTVRRYEYGYDGLDRLIETNYPNGLTESKFIETDQSKYSVSKRDKDGYLISLIELNYELNQLESIKSLNQDTGAVLEENYRYDIFGKLTESTDIQGQLTQYNYDPVFGLTNIEMPERDINEDRLSVDFSRDVFEWNIGSGLTKVFAETTSYQDYRFEMRFKDKIGQVLGTLAFWDDNKWVGSVLAYDDNAQVEKTYIGVVFTRTDNAFTIIGSLEDYQNKEFDYDGMGRVSREYASETFTQNGVSLGRMKIDYEYSADGSLRSRSLPYLDDEIGKILFEYDGAGRVTKETLQYEGETSFQDVSRTYNDFGELISIVYPNRIEDGQVKYGRTDFEYNDLGYLLREIRSVDDDPSNQLITHYKYDSRDLGRVIAVGDHRVSNTDGTLNENKMSLLGTWYGYTPEGRIAYEVAADAGALDKSIFHSGRMTDWTSDLASNQFIRMEYDDLGRTIRVVDGYGNLEERVYNEAGLLKYQRSNGNEQFLDYDRFGRTIKVSITEGFVKSGLIDFIDNTYSEKKDAVVSGLLDDTVGANEDYLYQFDYDVRNQVVSETDPYGYISTYRYDALGLLKEKTEPSGSKMIFTHNELGQVLQSQFYNPDNVLLKQQRTVYDGLGRPVQYHNGDTSLYTAKYVYDNHSNLIEEYDSKGRTAKMEYDQLDRMKHSYFADGRNLYLSYNAFGEVSNTQIQAGTDSNEPILNRPEVSVNYKFDTATRLVEEINKEYLHRDQQVIESFNYDHRGQTTGYGISLTSAKITNYEQGYETLFDYENRVFYVGYRGEDTYLPVYLNPNGSTDRIGASEVSGSFVYGYDRYDRENQLTYANGLEKVRSFDKLNNVVEESVFFGDEEVFSISQTFDYELGVITDQSVQRAGSSDSSYHFEYDKGRRLTQSSIESSFLKELSDFESSRALYRNADRYLVLPTTDRSPYVLAEKGGKNEDLVVYIDSESSEVIIELQEKASDIEYVEFKSQIDLESKFGKDNIDVSIGSSINSMTRLFDDQWEFTFPNSKTLLLKLDSPVDAKVISVRFLRDGRDPLEVLSSDEYKFLRDEGRDRNDEHASLLNSITHAVCVYSRTSRIVHDYTYGKGNELTRVEELISFADGVDLSRTQTLEKDGDENRTIHGEGGSYLYDNMGRRVVSYTSDGTFIYNYDLEGNLYQVYHRSQLEPLNDDLIDELKTYKTVDQLLNLFSTYGLGDFELVQENYYNAGSTRVYRIDYAEETERAYDYTPFGYLGLLEKARGATDWQDTWTAITDPNSGLILAEIEGSLTSSVETTVSQTVERSDLNGSVVSDLISIINTFDVENVLIYHSDQVGSTRAVTKRSGDSIVEVWQADYDAYGDFLDEASWNDNTYVPLVTFATHEHDKTTGLIYAKGRWYDPGNGEFISKDPYRNGANWYGYVSGNPIAYNDPSGYMQSDNDLGDEVDFSQFPGGSFTKSNFHAPNTESSANSTRGSGSFSSLQSNPKTSNTPSANNPSTSNMSTNKLNWPGDVGYPGEYRSFPTQPTSKTDPRNTPAGPNDGPNKGGDGNSSHRPRDTDIEDARREQARRSEQAAIAQVTFMAMLADPGKANAQMDSTYTYANDVTLTNLNYADNGKTDTRNGPGAATLNFLKGFGIGYGTDWVAINALFASPASSLLTIALGPAAIPMLMMGYMFGGDKWLMQQVSGIFGGDISKAENAGMETYRVVRDLVGAVVTAGGVKTFLQQNWNLLKSLGKGSWKLITSPLGFLDDLGRGIISNSKSGYKALMKHLSGKVDDAAKGATLKLPSSMLDELDTYMKAAGDGTLVRTKSSALPKSNTKAAWEKAMNRKVPDGFDVDHIIQRQFGGTDDITNLQLKPSSLNRSQGAKAYHLNKTTAYGTNYTNVEVVH